MRVQVKTQPDRSASEFKQRGFKVHEISRPENLSHANARRDYYKIVLATGHMTIGYQDQTIDIKDTFLFFVNPNIPHSVIHHSKKNKGYACLFTDTFIAGRERKEMLHNSPLFRFDKTPIIPLSAAQNIFLTGLFQEMLSAHRSDYGHKDDLIRNCIELIIHEASRIQPVHNDMKQKNGATRITYLFTELLERQFPIESSTDPLSLRTAQDFAENLSVHVNYLNRAVKEVTGKPTSVLIAERIAAEAKALLRHTNWSVADIAYGLGFEYPTYFNNYFKRVTGITPKSFRKNKV